MQPRDDTSFVCLIFVTKLYFSTLSLKLRNILHHSYNVTGKIESCPYHNDRSIGVHVLMCSEFRRISRVFHEQRKSAKIESE